MTSKAEDELEKLKEIPSLKGALKRKKEAEENKKLQEEIKKEEPSENISASKTNSKSIQKNAIKAPEPKSNKAPRSQKEDVSSPTLKNGKGRPPKLPYFKTTINIPVMYENFIYKRIPDIKLKGTVTDYISYLIGKDMEDNKDVYPEIYNQAMEEYAKATGN